MKPYAGTSFARPSYHFLGELPIYGYKQKHISALTGSSFPLGRVMNPPTAAAAWEARKDEILRYQDLMKVRGSMDHKQTVVETKAPTITRLNLRRFFDDEGLDPFETFGLPFEMFFDALDREGN
ncbi:unnamed protein product, partial [Amoebophrya sp. A25]|eukprot:GSA25T00021849001.1